MPTNTHTPPQLMGTYTAVPTFLVVFPITSDWLENLSAFIHHYGVEKGLPINAVLDSQAHALLDQWICDLSPYAGWINCETLVCPPCHEAHYWLRQANKCHLSRAESIICVGRALHALLNKPEHTH